MQAVQEDQSPQRRLASPRRLAVQDEDEKPLLRSPVSSPNNNARIAASTPISSHRRIPSMIFIVASCFLLAEYMSWRIGSRSVLSSSAFPCETKYATNIISSDGLNQITSTNKTELDFAILGFPKCGTTFLIYALDQHPQVVMPPDGTAPFEFCQIHNPKGHKELQDWLQTATSNASATTRYGIKCPTMIRGMNSIENLMKVSDRTKLIVGVRHPVWWFQSFYNYRVYEKRTDPKRYPDPIPSPFVLNKNKEWRDVSVAYARFDAYLSQLAKVPLRGNELKGMLNTDAFWEKRIQPNPYQVFIYTSEQLNDNNTTRQATFRGELQHFLGLDTPLVDFNTMPEMNKHDEVYPEYIDICNATYLSIRKELIAAGSKSSQWITNKFIRSQDVFVGNRDFFIEHLRSWKTDPCINQ